MVFRITKWGPQALHFMGGEVPGDVIGIAEHHLLAWVQLRKAKTSSRKLGYGSSWGPSQTSEEGGAKGGLHSI